MPQAGVGQPGPHLPAPPGAELAQHHDIRNLLDDRQADAGGALWPSPMQNVQASRDISRAGSTRVTG